MNTCPKCGAKPTNKEASVEWCNTCDFFWNGSGERYIPFVPLGDLKILKLNLD